MDIVRIRTNLVLLLLTDSRDNDNNVHRRSRENCASITAVDIRRASSRPILGCGDLTPNARAASH